MPVPRCTGLRIARSVETSNAENPTPDEYITKYIVTKWGVLVALFLTISLKLRSSNRSKPKRPENAFVNMFCLKPPKVVKAEAKIGKISITNEKDGKIP